MPAIEVKPGIYWIGVNDRTTDLFEGLWPIVNEGVSYNAYVITGEKNVLVDTAKDMTGDLLLAQIAEIVDPADLDYIVINHMEPDHTGILQTLRWIAPNVKILTTARAKKMLKNFYQISDNIHFVEDGEVLDLGSHKLHFHHAPMVHWPETMVTFESSQKVLFTCDAFGGYGALRGAIFDDQYENLDFYESEALRYYSNIVSSFSKPVLKAIAKVENLPIEVVAPSHGLIWRKDPQRIISLYKKWAEYAAGEPETGITLVYATMYGNTEQMVDAIAHGITQAGVPVEIFDVRRHHASYILPYLYSRKGVIIAAPTYEGGLFPPMAHLLDVVSRKRIRNRTVGYCGSFGWSGGARREITKWAAELCWNLTECWEFPGGPTKAETEQGVELGRRFAASLKTS